MDRRHAREVLGLPPLHTVDDVERAYRQRAWTAHPDRGGSREQFEALTESRRILIAAPASTGRIIAKDDRPLQRIASRLRCFRTKRPRRVT
jgi:DnaJ domain